jgi:hypothetical protein
MNRRDLLRGSAMIGLAKAGDPALGKWPSKPCVRLWCECEPDWKIDDGHPTVEDCVKFHQSKGRRIIHTYRSLDFGAVIVEIPCLHAQDAIVLADRITEMAGTDECHAEYGYLVEIASYAGE